MISMNNRERREREARIAEYDCGKVLTKHGDLLQYLESIYDKRRNLALQCCPLWNNALYTLKIFHLYWFNKMLTGQ